MKYYLTPSQWSQLWVQKHNDWTTSDDRLKTWTEMYSHIGCYDESTNHADPAYYGFIIGELKHINWFLLSL